MVQNLTNLISMNINTNKKVSTIQKNENSKKNSFVKVLNHSIKAQSKRPNNKKIKLKPTENKNVTKNSKMISVKKEGKTKVKEQKVCDEEAVVKHIAEQLGVNVEKLKNLLAEMNINIVDLFDTNKLSQLIMKTFEINDKIQLLEVPNVAEKIENIKEYLNSIKPELLKCVTEDNDTQSTVDKDSILNDSVKLDEDKSETMKTKEMPEKETDDTELDHSKEQPELIFNEKSNFEGLKFKVDSTETVNPLEQMTKDEIVQQIVEKIKVNLKDNISEMTVQLKPEHLGKLSFTLTSKEGIVTAQFFAENQHIKEAIELNLIQLKHTLEEQGIDVENMEVSIANNNYLDQNDNNQQQYNHQKQKKTFIKSVDNEIYEDEDNEQESSMIDESHQIDFSA